MDNLTLILAVVPSVMSCLVSVFYAYLIYKKSKEPKKDEIWETATKIICSNSGTSYSDDFAELYAELKFFKENQETCKKYPTIRKAMEPSATNAK